VQEAWKAGANPLHDQGQLHSKQLVDVVNKNAGITFGKDSTRTNRSRSRSQVVNTPTSGAAEAAQPALSSRRTTPRSRRKCVGPF